MRRKDREITDIHEILKIIAECPVLRLGLADGDYPYVVPVNFGYRYENGQLEFFIHGATAGRKFELMRQNPKCSFELDSQIKLECVSEQRYATTRYQSVMGTAGIEFIEGAEKKLVMDNIIMARYDETRGFDYDASSLAKTAIIKLTALSVSAKANLG